MARYEFSEGTSNKFWQIDLAGDSFTTTYGRIGTTGQSTTKTFDSAQKAQAEHDKLVAEKVKKGYALVGGAAPAAAPAIAAPAPKVAAAPKVVAAPTPPAAIQSPAPAAPKTAVASGEARVDWTPELAALAAKQRKVFDLEAAPKRDATSAFAWLRERFMKVGKVALEHGLVRATAHKERLKGVIRAYAHEAPAATFDPQVEADALRLLPQALNATYHGPQRGAASEALVELWVAKAGLPFALDAFTGSLAPVGIGTNWTPHACWLQDNAERPIEDLLATRTDHTLRRFLLGASTTEQAEARAHAIELRARGGLMVRSALSCVFLEPAWIDADLRERAGQGERSIVTELALLHAGSADAVAAYFAVMPEAEAIFLAPVETYAATRPPFSLCLLDRFRELGIAPLSRWLTRSAELIRLEDHVSRQLLFALKNLAETLQGVSGSEEVARAAVAVLTRCSGEKISKNEDPRPAAVVCLRNSPAAALAHVQAAARQKNGGWARDLAPQLERLSGTNDVRAEEANADEVPAPLNAKTTFKAPGLWSPGAFATPLLTSGKAFPAASMAAFGALLANHDVDAIARVKEASRPASLAAFGWDLFQAWLTAGAPSKEKWAFLALGLLGDDETARRLTPLVRAWPGESQHARAVLGLDVLAEIGSDVALMMLNGIAQKLKFKGLQEKAREKMDEIARKRGFTAEELANRLVPDLDLEDDGSKTLDFGPRSFRVGFDETLSPFVTDASGARLKDLPKPNAKDEAELASAAVEAWKAMKKDARTLSALELLRLELAMGNERRWRPKEFDDFLVHHPLLIHLVRRLVWGTFDDHGALVATFRVAEDRSYADREDETFALPDDLRVGVAHRLSLSDADTAAWSKIFGDYELAQPFEQLSRRVFVLDPSDLEGNALKHFVGRVVDTKKVLGLQGRGWRRGSAHDNGTIPYFYKPIAKDLNAGIQLDNGINAGSMEYTDPTQTLGIVDFGSGEPDWGRVRQNAVGLATIPRVVISEVVRDLESLGDTE